MDVKKAIEKSTGNKNPNILYMSSSDVIDKNMYLTGDWHLWLKDRDIDLKPTPIHFRNNGEEILEMYNALSEEDILINMGDLVDDEFYEFMNEEEQKACFSEMFDDIKCRRKILLIGNNDPVDKIDLFKELGWEVYDAIVIDDNLLITHMPIDISDDNLKHMMNVHAHQHGHTYYWTVPFTRHLDLWDPERKPVPLKTDVLKKLYDEYKVKTKDIFHEHLKTKLEFMKYRGVTSIKDPSCV